MPAIYGCPLNAGVGVGAILATTFLEVWQRGGEGKDNFAAGICNLADWACGRLWIESPSLNQAFRTLILAPG
ncbi:MAG TPA: hypothetical protein VE224_19350, partial [Pseudolabrys sp.]|nr:hypothetical protein [Pseudolabrys sp.]